VQNDIVIIPALLVALFTVIAYQFRSVLYNNGWKPRDHTEKKLLKNLKVKKICPNCGRTMENGEAVIRFWNNDPSIRALSVVKHGSATYYCPRCQLLDFSKG
jgi:hypothetical protein